MALDFPWPRCTTRIRQKKKWSISDNFGLRGLGIHKMARKKSATCIVLLIACVSRMHVNGV